METSKLKNEHKKTATKSVAVFLFLLTNLNKTKIIKIYSMFFRYPAKVRPLFRLINKQNLGLIFCPFVETK